MKIVGVVSVLSLSLILASCGFQSDPRSKFSSVQSVPKHNQPVDVKKIYKDANLFALSVPSGKLNFVEGSASSYTIKVTNQYPNASFKLTSPNLPEGAVLSRVSGDEGDYKLTWTPSIGFLPEGKPSDEFEFTIDVVVDAKSTNSDTEKLREIAGPSYETLTLVVNKTAEVPTFEAVTLASKEVVEGDPVALTITAKAPGVPADATLELVVGDSDWTTKEITLVKAKKATVFQPPQRSGDSFQYTAIIETKDIEIPKSKKPIQARLTLQLVNAAMSRKSKVETVILTILPKPAPAVDAAPAATEKVVPPATTEAKPATPKAKPKATPKKSKTTTAPKKTKTATAAKPAPKTTPKTTTDAKSKETPKETPKDKKEETK